MTRMTGLFINCDLRGIKKGMEREIVRMDKGVIVVTGGANENVGPWKGGLGRGSGEAHSVSDSRFKNRCRGPIDKTATIGKYSRDACVY